MVVGEQTGLLRLRPGGERPYFCIHRLGKHQCCGVRGQSISLTRNHMHCSIILLNKLALVKSFEWHFAFFKVRDWFIKLPLVNGLPKVLHLAVTNVQNQDIEKIEDGRSMASFCASDEGKNSSGPVPR
jgi:hypothetical protein